MREERSQQKKSPRFKAPPPVQVTLLGELPNCLKFRHGLVDMSGVARMNAFDKFSAGLRQQTKSDRNADDACLRNSYRRKAYLNGRILFNLGRSSMSVRVRDLSEDGTRLSLSIPWPCPRRFKLEIDRNAPAAPLIHRCEVVWQRGMSLGVRFID